MGLELHYYGRNRVLMKLIFSLNLEEEYREFFGENIITQKHLKHSFTHSIFDADSEYNIILYNN